MQVTSTASQNGLPHFTPAATAANRHINPALRTAALLRIVTGTIAAHRLTHGAEPDLLLCSRQLFLAVVLLLPATVGTVTLVRSDSLPGIQAKAVTLGTTEVQ